MTAHLIWKRGYPLWLRLQAGPLKRGLGRLLNSQRGAANRYRARHRAA
jgi:hypothetical protein